MLDLQSKAELGEKVIERFAWVQQAEEMDCGAACLAMICKHYGIGMTLGKLRELANVTTQGATLDSLARTGESLGFTTRGVQCTFDTLRGFELPFIVHWEGYHYVVVYGVSTRQVWVADPAIGFKKLSIEEFERGWSGTCLVFTPRQDMAQVAASRSPWVRFARYLVPHKKILLHLFLATFVIQMLGIVPPMIIQNILDGVIVHQNVNLLHLLIAGLIISNVFTQLMATIRACAVELHGAQARLHDDVAVLQAHAVAAVLVLRQAQDRRHLRALPGEPDDPGLPDRSRPSRTVLNLLMIFIYFTVMFLYNVKLTLLLIAFVIPILALTVLVTPKIKTYARESFGASTDAKSYLMEALGGVETVKGMGIERPVRLKWEKKYAKALEVQYRAQSFNIMVGLAGQLLNAATTDRDPVGRRQPGARARADDRPADRVQRPDGQRARAADGPGRTVEPAERRRGGDGAPGRRARPRARAEARGPGHRASRCPICRATSASTASTSATAATRRPTCWRTSAWTSSPAS